MRASRRMGHTRFLILATASVRGLQITSPQKIEGAGKTGCALHPRSRVHWCTVKCAHERTGEAETLRPSLRNGFTTYIVLSLVNRSLLPPSPPKGVSLSRT
jgi:hypothetical protein